MKTETQELTIPVQGLFPDIPMANIPNRYYDRLIQFVDTVNAIQKDEVDSNKVEVTYCKLEIIYNELMFPFEYIIPAHPFWIERVTPVFRFLTTAMESVVGAKHKDVKAYKKIISMNNLTWGKYIDAMDNYSQGGDV